MNPTIQRSRRLHPESGSILMLTIIAACLLGLTLGSYLLMVRAESVSVARSQAWNAALVVAGGGVEEALAALNQNAAGQPSNWGPPDLSTNGWPQSGGGYGPLSRSLMSGSVTNGSYSVFVTAGSPPVIYSTGYVTVPSISARISRVVRVTTTNAPLFTTALAAKTNITLEYSGDFSDSFDSSIRPYQDTNSSANGSLACMSGLVDVAYRKIHGDIVLGPTAVLQGNTYSVSGQTRTNLNVDFPEVTPLPTGGCVTSLAGPALNTNGMHYDSVLSGMVPYVIPSLNQSLYVPAGQNVSLQITGNANLKGLCIAGSGNNAGRLTIYMSGPNFTFGAPTIVENRNATNLSYFGLAGNTNVTINLFGNNNPTTTNFYGTIYAPSANASVYDDYSTNVPYAFFGAMTAKSINQKGRLEFHFDENLLRAGRRRGFLVTSWQEL